MIHPYAECDNCGYLFKVEASTSVPPDWGTFSCKVRTGSGLDARVNTRDQLLCGDCVSAVRRGLHEAVRPGVPS